MSLYTLRVVGGTQLRVVCDRCGRDFGCLSADRAETLRVYAKDEGWSSRYSDGRDWCPRCSEALAVSR